jgi:GNAT superfamily N-acetyltransferase
VIPPSVHDDDDVRAWFASHVVRDTELWVAEDRAGTLVGILVLEGRWLDQLYVEPTMTGRGIGAGLLKLAKRERPEGLRLWTFASNAGAQRFYESHGFYASPRGRRQTVLTSCAEIHTAPAPTITAPLPEDGP